MDHHLGRVVSDLSHSNSRGARRHGLHHQSTTRRTNTDGGGGSTAKQKLALLFSGVVAWARKESGATAEPGSSRPAAKSSRQQEAATNNNGGGGARRRGVDIVMAVRKYVSMVEQLFASYSGGGGGRNDGDARRRRPHTFTYARGGGGASSSKRHKGRLTSAPASLRGSPANSGHLAVGESVMTTKKASTSSEVSTMEELHSAIQAAIAHCKSSAAAGGGDGRQ